MIFVTYLLTIEQNDSAEKFPLPYMSTGKSDSDEQNGKTIDEKDAVDAQTECRHIGSSSAKDAISFYYFIFLQYWGNFNYVNRSVSVNPFCILKSNNIVDDKTTILVGKV